MGLNWASRHPACMVSCHSAPSPGQTLAGWCNPFPGAMCACCNPANRVGVKPKPENKWSLPAAKTGKNRSEQNIPPEEGSHTAHRLLELLLSRQQTKHHLEFLPQTESMRVASRANGYLPDCNLARTSGSLGSLGKTPRSQQHRQDSYIRVLFLHKPSWLLNQLSQWEEMGHVQQRKYLFYLLQAWAVRQTCSFSGEGAHNEQIKEKNLWPDGGTKTSDHNSR